MSDSPGWASPGSTPPENDPQRSGAGTGPDAERPDPTPGQAQGWGAASPPPGQPGWSSQPPSWGGGPAGFGGWHRNALAPKPGVIPLRPLGVGEILDGAVSTARAHWRTVLGITLAIAVITQLISVAAIRLWLSDNSGLAALEQNSKPTNDELRDALGDLLAFGSVTGLITLLGTVLATAMLTIVVSRAVLGHGVTMAEAWQDSRGRLMRLLGLVLVVPLIAALCLATPILVATASGSAALLLLGTLAGAALAVWIWVRFSLAAPALMLERQGIGAALRRSWKLVGGSWWRVFGIQLLIMVLLLIVAGIVEFPATILAELVSGNGIDGLTSGAVGDMTWTYLAISGLGAVISSAITLPISAGVTALLYMDQRIRREALDLELARAAGIDDRPAPGY